MLASNLANIKICNNASDNIENILNYYIASFPLNKYIKLIALSFDVSHVFTWIRHEISCL